MLWRAGTGVWEGGGRQSREERDVAVDGVERKHEIKWLRTHLATLRSQASVFREVNDSVHFTLCILHGRGEGVACVLERDE